jgi:hypothetical protein
MDHVPTFFGTNISNITLFFVSVCRNGRLAFILCLDVVNNGR